MAARRPRPRETITLDLELVHEILDVLDFYLRGQDEGPRHDSRGDVMWGVEWPGVLEFAFAVETELKDHLAELEKQRAIAEALAAHGITRDRPAGRQARERRALLPNGERP